MGGIVSLLALTGMFIFGGKKKRKTLEEVSKELAKKYGLPEEVIDGIAGAYLPFNGYIEFIRQIDPEKNYERVKKLLQLMKLATQNVPEQSLTMSTILILGERPKVPGV